MSLDQPSWYPTPPRLRDDLHVRFMDVVRRATQASELPLEVLAETPDDEEDEGGAEVECGAGEGLGDGHTES